MRSDGWEYGAWQKHERFLINAPLSIEERLYNAYEAGADAYEEGLEKQSIDVEDLRASSIGMVGDTPMYAIRLPNKKGQLVFIEE